MPTFTLTSTNARRSGVDVVDLRGWFAKGETRRTLVSFAASWCKPCRREIRDLTQARTALENADVRVVIVVADEEDAGRGAMIDWLEEQRVPFPAVIDDFGLLTRRFRASALPAVFVADARGVLVDVAFGFEKENLRALVAEPPKSKNKKGKRKVELRSNSGS